MFHLANVDSIWEIEVELRGRGAAEALVALAVS